jgi:hypothetical protein
MLGQKITILNFFLNFWIKKKNCFSHFRFFAGSFMKTASDFNFSKNQNRWFFDSENLKEP